MKNKKKIIGSVIVLAVFGVFLFLGYVSMKSMASSSVEVDNSYEETQNNIKSTDNNQGVKKKIKAQIYGEVKTPGVYSLDADDRVCDLINAAGGFTDKADRYSVNGAAKVNDGENLCVRAKGEKTSTTSAQTSEASQNDTASVEKLDINSATAEDIVNKKIRGIGAGLAKKIIDYREKNGGRINSVEDLKKAIGPKRGEDLMQYVEIN